VKGDYPLMADDPGGRPAQKRNASLKEDLMLILEFTEENESS